MLKKLHHVAYRCRDAAETVDFYANVIGMKFAAALVQEKVPSIGIDAPHTHIFFEMEDGSHLAFFEILGSTEPRTPVEKDWAQHLAMECESEQRAEAISARLRARGVEVIGPVKHGEMARSWYFYDPSGHRMEMAVRAAGEKAVWEKAQKSAYEDLARWQARKKAAAA
jgi:glyoxylase I family protein